MTEIVKEYNTDTLKAWIPDVTEEMVRPHIENFPRDETIEIGNNLITRRITKDGVRIYGHGYDFYKIATDPQRDLLIGVSEELLKIYIWILIKGDETFRAREGESSDKNDTAGLKNNSAQNSKSIALSYREILYCGLRSIAAGRKSWMNKLDLAYGTVGDTDPMERSFTKMESLGREMLRAPELAPSREKTKITTAWLDKFHEVTRTCVEQATADDSVGAAPSITQGEVDFWDGVNVQEIKQVIDVFDAANRIDPSIPRLVPISLHSFYYPGTRKKDPTENTPTS